MNDQAPVIEVIDDVQAAMIRRTPGWQRVQAASDMHRFGVGVVTASVRTRYPEWTESQVKEEVFRRVMGGSV